LSQGLPKKIEVHLLLTDLALKLGNTLAGRIELAQGCRGGLRWTRGRNRNLARSTDTSQRLGAAGAKVVAPKVEILAENLQLSRKLAHVLSP
jgi:hypothetical protein